MSTELPICILTGERPIDGSLCDVAGLLPGVNLALQAVSAFNSPVQPLTTENANLDLRHVQPTRVLGRVVELHSAQELGRCAFAQHVVKISSEVDVQVVEHQMNAASLGIRVGQQVTDERREVCRAYSSSKAYMRLRYSSVNAPMHHISLRQGLRSFF
jgi:hypothetical protein